MCSLLQNKITGETPEVRSDKRKPNEGRQIMDIIDIKDLKDIMDLIDKMDLIDIIDLIDIMDLINIIDLILSTILSVISSHTHIANCTTPPSRTGSIKRDFNQIFISRLCLCNFSHQSRL